jgi:hypothetical protein
MATFPPSEYDVRGPRIPVPRRVRTPDWSRIVGFAIGVGVGVAIAKMAPSSQAQLPDAATERPSDRATHNYSTGGFVVNDVPSELASDVGCAVNQEPRTAHADAQPWIAQARQLESKLPLRTFLREQRMDEETFERLMGASWIVQDIAQLELAISGMASANLVKAWQLEEQFWVRLRPLFASRPPAGAPFDERVYYQRNTLAPAVRSATEVLCCELARLGLAPQLLEGFRLRIQEDY